jgi:hypothetical protein
LPAILTFSPIALVVFRVMITAEGVAPVVSVATVLGIRENDVLVLIIAYPLATAFCSGQLAFLSTQPTTLSFGC